MIARLALAVGTMTLLAGCSYDYAQHTDRVAYSAGDAVRANIERETASPSKRSMYATKGLGANGRVVTVPAADASP